MGSGKTSLIHLIVHHIRSRGRIIPVFFNPWMFSGADELVSRFFEEVAGQLNESGGHAKVISAKLARLGDTLAPLGEAPFVGAYARALLS